MRAYVVSATGPTKVECEDAVLVGGSVISGEAVELEVESPRLVAVLDGVGGNAGGAIASKGVAEALSSLDFAQSDESMIRLALNGINDELLEKASRTAGKEAMATTLTCLIESADGLYLAHAGNTRACVMQGKYMRQLTTDHTTAEYLRLIGRSEEAESCNRNEISCCFGGGDAGYLRGMVVRRLFDASEGFPATMVLTTDGVHDYLAVEDMEDFLAESSFGGLETARSIVHAAAEGGSLDDRTIVIVRR